jgi:hypothetical protein
LRIDFGLLIAEGGSIGEGGFIAQALIRDARLQKSTIPPHSVLANPQSIRNPPSPIRRPRDRRRSIGVRGPQVAARSQRNPHGGKELFVDDEAPGAMLGDELL